MPASITSRRDAFALLVLRVGVSALLLFGHGLPKVLTFAERSQKFSDPLGVGSAASLTLVVFAEVVCSSLVALGLFTRLATVPLLIFFSVAAFVQHAHDPFARKELALLFALPYLLLLFTGPGRFSLDAWIARVTGRD